MFDLPVIAAEPEGEGWAIAMQDVSDALLPAGETVSQDQARRLLAAADAMHRRFDGRTFPAACTLVDRRFPAGADPGMGLTFQSLEPLASMTRARLTALVGEAPSLG